jgi:hypothetical protein
VAMLVDGIAGGASTTSRCPREDKMSQDFTIIYHLIFSILGNGTSLAIPPCVTERAWDWNAQLPNGSGARDEY